MERELLCSLEPKDKEHQRKKILRHFFSWTNKSYQLPLKKQSFWLWVHSLNPDNTSSETRYKSMSYQFLDRLLSVKEFRKVFSSWISKYQETLTASEEDRRTKIFIKFMLQTIEAKQSIYRIFKKYQDSFVSYPVKLWNSILFSQAYPTNKGLYLEGTCYNSACSRYKQKMYVYIGINENFEVINEDSTIFCFSCRESYFRKCAIGFQDCKLQFTGTSHESQTVNSKVFFSLGYSNLDDIHLYRFTSMQICVNSFTDLEYNSIHEEIQNILISNSALLNSKQQKYTQTDICLESDSIVLGKRLREQETEIQELKKKLKRYEE